LLDCDRGRTASGPVGQTDGVGQVVWTSIEAPAEPTVDPRTFGPFKREICDQMHAPLPPYIGLPRWMPGTLIISESLRLGYGCPPPASPPSLPMPLVHVLETPAEPDPAGPSDDLRINALTADGRLARWSSLAADVDLPPAAEALEPAGVEPATERADESREADGEQPDEETFFKTVSRIRWLQSALTLENYHPGPIDGVMGEKTMEAVRAWRRDNDQADPLGDLTEKEFWDIIETFVSRFGQLREPAGSF
ncbi:MAG: peptidoglycan-binding domain-containing protein, partial [Geminicoccaceae bacterium]